ncbi:MAG: lysophospholipid acyltransferase family protein [Sphingobacteriia bacterium]|nr:lysophospholipid acyltransferase family protein [Sphingobacteriia bacterium]
MKRILKRILKSHAFIKILALLISIYLKFLHLTIRWQGESKDALKNYKKENVILVFWHGRMLMMPFLWPKPRKMNVLISHHSDGEIIAKTIEFLGYKLIRGSSSKGGTQALRSILTTLKNNSVAMTPDGPRGPRMKISGALTTIAKISGKPIILVTYSTEKAKVLKTWDKMILPKFFSKGYALASQPIYVNKRISEEETKKLELEIEEKINNMTFEVDKIAGINIEK